jgi:hypothetical protein
VVEGAWGIEGVDEGVEDLNLVVLWIIVSFLYRPIYLTEVHWNLKVITVRPLAQQSPLPFLLLSSHS